MSSQEFQLVVERIHGIPQLSGFAGLDELFEAYHTESGQLPTAAYQMLVPASQRRDTLPVEAAVLCVIVAGFLFDNLMDRDPGKPESKLDEGRRSNLAASLLVAAYKLITESEFPQPVQLRIIGELSTLLLEAGRAQELEARLSRDEIPNRNPEENYWAVQHGKSSQQIGRFVKLGAIMAEKPDWEELAFAFGVAYGDMLQLLDDMTDALHKSISPDWDTTSKNLLIIFCLNENNPRRAAFQEQFNRAKEDERAHHACRQMMIESGALGYAVYQYYDRYLKARKLINTLEGYDTGKLASLIRDNIRAVSTFLHNMGVKLPAEITEDLGLK